MELQSIIFVVIIILIVYIFAQAFSGETRLTEVSDAQVEQKILAAKLPKADVPNMNCTYSLWIYVGEWNYRYGEKKVIFGRSDEFENQGPLVSFSPTQNNIDVEVDVYPNTNEESNVTHTCTVTNVPLQKWVNIMLSVYNKTLDVYVDGKLSRSCLLPGVPRLSRSEDIIITPNGGFAGNTAGFQFWDEESTPERAWNIYTKGYTGNYMNNLFYGLNSYGAKLSILENGQETASLSF
jgi:hypothetical protein